MLFRSNLANAELSSKAIIAPSKQSSAFARFAELLSGNEKGKWEENKCMLALLSPTCSRRLSSMNLKELSFKSGVNKMKVIQVRKRVHLLESTSGIINPSLLSDMEKLLQEVEGFLSYLETHGHSIEAGA